MLISRNNRYNQEYGWQTYLKGHDYIDGVEVEPFEETTSSSSYSSSSSFSSSSSLSSSSNSSSSSVSSSSSSFSSSSSSSNGLESSSSSSSSSSYGYCNDIVYAEGFGSATYNGTYTITGNYNDKPYWTNENGKVIFWQKGGSFWAMAPSAGGLQVYRNSDTGVPETCPYGSNCLDWETWPGGGASGTVCVGEFSSSSSSSSP